MDHTRLPMPDTPDEDVQDVAIAKADSPETESQPKLEEDSDITDDESIEHIIDDITECFNDGAEIYETTFYKVVLGGHTETVRKVIHLMESNEQFELIKWILTSKCVNRSIFFKKIEKKETLTCTRILMFCIAIFFGVFFSPYFYLVHGLTCTIFKQKYRQLTKKIRLPLVFAALSQSKEMCQLLVSMNVHTEQRDKHGNNVFHYLADFSVESSQSASAAFDVIVQFIPQHDDILYKMLFVEKNSQGLTALEMVAAFGSAALLRKMMNADPKLTDTRLVVAEKGVMYPKFRNVNNNKDSYTNEAMEPLMDESEKDKKIATQRKGRDACTKVNYTDVTMYESTDVATRSFLLRLIGNRNVESYSVKDLTLLQKCPLIGKWIKIKIAEMRRWIYIVHALDVFVTLMMVILLVLLRQSVSLKTQMASSTLTVQIKEIVARQDNSSFVLKPQAFVQSSAAQEVDMALDWILQEIDWSNIKRGLVDIGAADETADQSLVYDIIANLDMNDKEQLVNSIVANVPVTWETVGLQSLSLIVQEYAKYLVKMTPDLPVMDVRSNHYELEEFLENRFDDFKINISGYYVFPSKMFSYRKWQELFCLPWRQHQPSDFMRAPSIPPPNGTVDDICMWQSIVDMAQNSCSPNTPREVYKKWRIISSRTEIHKTASNVLMAILGIASCLYIILDIYEHTTFFGVCIMANNTLLGMCLSVLSWKIPGSYYRKELNIITHYCIAFHIFTQPPFISPGLQNLLTFKYTHYILLIALILRCIMHIHALRLLPWIGHFVTTTFMMATNLIHFSTILGVVICVFAVILHLLVVDVDCPVRQHEGYATLRKSLLSVFMLTFGHGDFAQYKITTPVIVTYVLYVIICSLLLLNLIIAIMSATATDLMTMEGKQTLKMTEWLHEALSVEYTVIAVAGQFASKFLYKNQKKAGFVVEGQDECRRVFIKVFYCSKLD